MWWIKQPFPVLPAVDASVVELPLTVQQLLSSDSLPGLSHLLHRFTAWTLTHDPTIQRMIILSYTVLDARATSLSYTLLGTAE